MLRLPRLQAMKYGARQSVGVRRDPPGLVAEAGQLDLDDVGAPLTEGGRRLRALDEQPRLDDPDPVQCSHVASLLDGSLADGRPVSRDWWLRAGGRPAGPDGAAADSGGRDRRRSGDLALFRRALCQLSYPTRARRPYRAARWRSRRDLNPRPPA